MMQAFIVSVPLLLLLYACTEVTSVIQKRFGIEICKRHCARYNRCYGIRYNITSITCTILNDRNTDGDDLHLSRRDILQEFLDGESTNDITSAISAPSATCSYERFQPQDDCAASQYYRTRLCIINNIGRAVEIAETRTSLEEAIKETEAVNISTPNLICAISSYVPLNKVWSIPHRSCSHTDVFWGIIEKDFLPRTRYVTTIVFSCSHISRCRTNSEDRLLTISVTDASNIDFSRMTWNITYTSTNGTLAAHYYGLRGYVTNVKVFANNVQNIFLLFDRSSSGNFLHDIDVLGKFRGSIELPNVNKSMRIALRLYLPHNGTVSQPKPAKMNCEKELENWYRVHFNYSFL